MASGTLAFEIVGIAAVALRKDPSSPVALAATQEPLLLCRLCEPNQISCSLVSSLYILPGYVGAVHELGKRQARHF